MVFTAIVYVLTSGCAWRWLPPSFGVKVPTASSTAPPRGEVNFGLASTPQSMQLDQLQLDWYDRWLKGDENVVIDEAPVKIFVVGVNQSRDENEWPPARAVDTPWHLGADGALTQHPPTTGETPDHYRYDPADPVLTRGGNLVIDDDATNSRALASFAELAETTDCS